VSGTSRSDADNALRGLVEPKAIAMTKSTYAIVEHDGVGLHQQRPAVAIAPPAVQARGREAATGGGDRPETGGRG